MRGNKEKFAGIKYEIELNALGNFCTLCSVRQQISSVCSSFVFQYFCLFPTIFVQKVCLTRQFETGSSRTFNVCGSIINFKTFSNSPQANSCSYRLRFLTKHLSTKSYYAINNICNLGQIKHQLDATLCRFYFCRVTLHVSGFKRPSSGVLKNWHGDP